MSMNHSDLPFPADFAERARLLGTSTLFEARTCPVR